MAFPEAEIPDLISAWHLLSHVKSTLQFRSGSATVFCIYLLPPLSIYHRRRQTCFGNTSCCGMVYRLLSSWCNSITFMQHLKVSTVITQAWQFAGQPYSAEEHIVPLEGPFSVSAISELVKHSYALYTGGLHIKMQIFVKTLTGKTITLEVRRR
ncbi:hypothetical protein PO909_006209 [Leuciscus waleckii]